MTPPEPIPLLSSISLLAPLHEAWICDIWGVLHNGVRAFGAASDACRSFRRSGGIVLLLSNAPRPGEDVQVQLDRMGVPRDAYDTILTSGDLTRALVRDHPSRRILHIGPERDKPIFAGLDRTLANDSEAELVVCSGLCDDDRETPEDYLPLFRRLVARGLPMICANPDLTVERGERLVFCAGSLSADYERLGGSVIYAGKPHLPVYRLAFDRIAAIKGRPVAPERIVAIGDVIRTDIRGAANAGISSVFIASAIHVSGPLDAEKLEALFNGSDVRPVAALPALVW
jgi:HAD superfamily hydrolase (TIGR01459 family)